MDYRKESLRLHGEWKGKVEVVARAKVDNKDACPWPTPPVWPSLAWRFRQITTKAGS